MKSLIPASVAICLVVSNARAHFPTFPCADRVIGKSDFTSQGSTTACVTSLRSPSGLAIDPTSGKLFVVPDTQHRILRYPDVASLANGAAVEAVIGQSALGTTAWKLLAKLKTGKNTLEIFAVDSFGNVSPPKTVKVKRL